MLLPVLLRPLRVVPVQYGPLWLCSAPLGAVEPGTLTISTARLSEFLKFSMRIDAVRRGSLPLGVSRIGPVSRGPKKFWSGAARSSVAQCTVSWFFVCDPFALPMMLLTEKSITKRFKVLKRTWMQKVSSS